MDFFSLATFVDVLHLLLLSYMCMMCLFSLFLSLFVGSLFVCFRLLVACFCLFVRWQVGVYSVWCSAKFYFSIKQGCCCYM